MKSPKYEELFSRLGQSNCVCFCACLCSRYTLENNWFKGYPGKVKIKFFSQIKPLENVFSLNPDLDFAIFMEIALRT